MIDDAAIRIIAAADEVTPEMLAQVEDCLEWFDLEEPLPTEDFVDRLCNTYLIRDFGVELGDYDSPATRKFLREARKIRAEQRGW